MSTHFSDVIGRSRKGIFPICFTSKINYSERSVIDDRLGYNSHFKIEKSDYSDVLFGREVASSPQNFSSCVCGIPRLSDSSLNCVVCLYKSMTLLMCHSLLYRLTSSRCCTSNFSNSSSSNLLSRNGRYSPVKSKMK